MTSLHSPQELRSAGDPSDAARAKRFRCRVLAELQANLHRQACYASSKKKVARGGFESTCHLLVDTVNLARTEPQNLKAQIPAEACGSQQRHLSAKHRAVFGQGLIQRAAPTRATEAICRVSPAGKTYWVLVLGRGHGAVATVSAVPDPDATGRHRKPVPNQSLLRAHGPCLTQKGF